MESEADLRGMFAYKPDGPCDSASYRGKAIPVIFDRSYLQQIGLVAGFEPIAIAITADLATSPVGDALAVKGASYTIVSAEQQDDGATTLLRLER